MIVFGLFTCLAVVILKTVFHATPRSTHTFNFNTRIPLALNPVLYSLVRASEVSCRFVLLDKMYPRIFFLKPDKSSFG